VQGAWVGYGNTRCNNGGRRCCSVRQFRQGDANTGVSSSRHTEDGGDCEQNIGTNGWSDPAITHGNNVGCSNSDTYMHKYIPASAYKHIHMYMHIYT
jgi:hypothetical protein